MPRGSAILAAPRAAGSQGVPKAAENRLTRLALRETFSLLLIYLLAAGGLGWWVHAELRASAERLAEQTARLIGREVASVVQSAMPEPVPRAGSRGHRELIETVRDVAGRSAVVESVALVGPDGTVTASDSEGLVGRGRPTPAELFGADPRVRLVDAGGPGLEAGHYTMEIPLPLEGPPTGYLTLTLASEELAALYHDRRRRVSWFGAAALGVIGLLGFLLHVQLAERGRRLRRALDAALAGEEIAESRSRRRPGADPFARALAAAGRVGRELRDVRRRTERVEHRLAQLGEILDVGVALLGADRTIDFASDRARELLGLDHGKPDALPEDLVTAIDRAWQERREGATVEIAPRGSGSRRLRCQVHPLDEEDCVGWLLVVRDASLMRLLEIDLRRAARLRVLSQVYLAVAHDLKAPLNGMVLNLELLRESLADGAEIGRENQRRWVEVIERELSRLRRSLDTLLAQTAPASDELERFDLRSTVEEIEDLLAPQARRQQVRLVTDLPAEPVTVAGHRDHLKQAMLNVAINGLEVLDEGGTLELTLRGEGESAALAVRDTGPGIPPDLVQRIFDMHFTTKNSGTGIGLYVARSVIESEGGELDVADTGPDGTTFVVRLPRAPEAAEEGSA
jgi:signal transduction histidine kinase